MLTFFATPKPFIGHTKIIQINAIKSWALLNPKCEIILFGDAEGTSDLATELNIRNIPDIEYNKYGTPLISSMFDIAQDVAKHELLCHISSDIIVMDDFLPVINQVKKQSFLLVWQRWDFDFDKLIDFDNPNWDKNLRSQVKLKGNLHGKSAIDIYVFPRNQLRNIPKFAVGRTSYDNWLLYQTYILKIPLIDATEDVITVHQNHDYSHHPEGAIGVWNGVESKINYELTGGVDHLFSLEYVNWLANFYGVRRALSLRSIYFQIRALTIVNSYFHFLLPIFKIFEKLVIKGRELS